MAFKNLFNKNTGNGNKPVEIKGADESKETLEKTGGPSMFEAREKPDPATTTVADLYPFGFTQYGVIAPETDTMHTCISKVTCPACGKEIAVIMPLTSTLHLKKIDNDLRRHYKEFEPIWYDVWYCPHCYFTALYTDFESDKGNVAFYASRIMQAMTPYREADILTFTTPRTVEEVLTSMYLAIRCADFYDCKPLTVAKLWLHISWIYQDIGDEECFIKASEKALEAYKRMYYEAREDFAPVIEQTCFLVMGELNILLKNYKDAYECLVHSKLVDGGNRLHKMNAQNRIDDVREMMHEEGK